MDIKIVTVIGARPQFIKAAMLSREFKNHADINEILIHTGQHFDVNMSEVFFNEMNIPRPHYNLNINSLGHGAMTGRMLEEIEKILLVVKPNYVLVYGDTNSTLAAALAAVKLHIKVIHIEAGLRSFDKRMPEEINRILTDRVSDLLFCPSQTSFDLLASEGISNNSKHFIENVGDIMMDAALHFKTIGKNVHLPIKSNSKFILATLHRAENTDNPENLRAIVSALNEIHLETEIVMPIHPRTKEILNREGIEVKFTFIDPVGYIEMCRLLDLTTLVITDSGGLQKEAYYFKKKCITIRENTEWTELVQYGYNILAGSSKERILEAYKSLNGTSPNWKTDIYGNGRTSSAIVNSIINYTNSNK